MTETADKQQEKTPNIPKINLGMCSKNYSCAVFCPRNAISINQKGFPAIDSNLCDGCLICLRECPVGAILEDRK